MTKMHNECMKEQCAQFDGGIWRRDRYWNEGVDNIYKAFYPLLDYLYKKLGGKHMKPSEK